MSCDDVRAMKKMDRETILVDGHYQVPMLWDNSRKKLPDNLPMARKRYHHLEKKLRADKELYTRYKTVIDGYLQQNPPYARLMAPEEVQKRTPKTWILPSFPVFNPNKPGKIRVVKDAAALYQGECLNNNLLTGPDILNSLTGVLLNFRIHKVAVAADIEAMFHQVRVDPTDADSLRFLWKDDITAEGSPQMYQMLVHIFGAKDSPTCANYAVKRTARDNIDKFDPATIETALRAFYVDDLLKSVPSEEMAIWLSKELISLLKSGGFRLTKFSSTSQVVLDALPKSEVSPACTVQIDAEENMHRALGIAFEVTKDLFTFTIEIEEEAPDTKRWILKITASIFDPIGFLTPFILVAKVILQDLWRMGSDWDDLVDGLIKKRWRKWLEGAKKLSRIKIPRRYTTDERQPNEIQLHVFCDASEVAYGCVAYVRFTFKSGEHSCSLVMSKSRLAPIKTVTVPRLELSAARLGARLGHFIRYELDLPVERIQYWSDSTLTMQYLNNNTHRMKVYVANRVTEILDLTKQEEWGHVPGELNTADLLTRGVQDPEELMKSRWPIAPSFLELDEEFWPRLNFDSLDSEDVEIKKKSVLVAIALVETEGIDLTRISNWVRLKRTVGWTLRFLSNCRSEKSERCKDPLTVDELQLAEEAILRDMQKTEFDGELRTLTEGKTLKSPHRLFKLCPQIDSVGILRVGGRLKNIAIPMEMKHPPIIPGSHAVTKIIIDWVHRHNGHVGPDHVLSLLRTMYWIISARTAVRQVLHMCFFCKVRRAQQQFPFMADLPVCRAAIEEPPFTHCGVDLFGPILVKQGRKQLKRWAVLLTCMTIRCVHLDVVDSCETDAFINALRRFTNRRGCPRIMYSDNGTNFKGTTTELKEFIKKLELDEEKIVDYLGAMKIKWTFNPPAAPHMGGAWERLVRSSKEVMYGLVKDRVLTDPQLYTLLTEVEMILNSRPLTHLSEDPDDYEPLTPNHVLLGFHRNWASIADTSDTDVTSRRKWKQVQALRSMFWSRWTKEYLPLLNERNKSTEKGANLKVGQLVLVQDDNVKRNKWPLARITRTMPGSDGVVRVVEIVNRSGTYTRPVSKVFVLEDDVVKGGRNVGDKFCNN